MQMTSADLDRIDSVLTPLVASEPCSDEAKAAVQRFNARLEEERSRVGSARARLGTAGSVPVDVAVALEAAAVMLTVERDRIVRQFRFVPVRSSRA